MTALIFNLKDSLKLQVWKCFLRNTSAIEGTGWEHQYQVMWLIVPSSTQTKIKFQTIFLITRYL